MLQEETGNAATALHHNQKASEHAPGCSLRSEGSHPGAVFWCVMENDLFELLVQFHETPLILYPLHRRLTGSITQAVLLAYLLRQCKYHESFRFMCALEDIQEATGLTVGEIRLARARLVDLGILRTDRIGVGARLQFRLRRGFICREVRTDLQNKPRGRLAEIASQTCRNSKSDLQKPQVRGRTKPYKNRQKGDVLDPKIRVRQKGLSVGPWRGLADQLAKAISSVRKINYTSNLASWARSFEMLHKRQGIDVVRIEKVLKWYCDVMPSHTNDQFFIVAHSGQAFREKFDRIEMAMQREANNGQESQEEQSPASRGRLRVFDKPCKRPLAEVWEVERPQGLVIQRMQRDGDLPKGPWKEVQREYLRKYVPEAYRTVDWDAV